MAIRNNLNDLKSVSAYDVGGSKLTSTKLSLTNSAKISVGKSAISDNNKKIVKDPIFTPIKNPTIANYENEGKVAVYVGEPDKWVNSKTIEVDLHVEYDSRSEYPISIDKKVTNIVNKGTYKIKSEGLKTRNARVTGIEVLTNKGLIDAIEYYKFSPSTGIITLVLKDISSYNITSLTFRIYYAYIGNTGSLKFINKTNDYKKKYKIYGRFKAKAHTYKLTDVSGLTFTKYKSGIDLATTPAVTNSSNTIGIHTTYTANPYDIEQWIEKREIYYIPNGTGVATASLNKTTTQLLTTNYSFYKTGGFTENTSILTNIPLNYETMDIPSSYNSKNTFQYEFRKDRVSGNDHYSYYEDDAIRRLRGNIVNEEVFYNRRKAAMEQSLIDLMNGYSEDYSLTDEYLQSNGKDRVYNFAKGYSNMVNQEALNVKDELVNKRALEKGDDFNYQVIFEKRAYDSTNITKINESTNEDQEKALLSYMQFSPTGSRELLERLAQAMNYPLNKLYEESYMEKAKRDIAINGKTFEPERNSHLKYYNLTKPALDNTIKGEFADNSYDIARTILSKGFNKIFFGDIWYFNSKIPAPVLDRVAAADTAIPSGDTSVTYKVVYSNSQEEVDEIDDLIANLITPNDGTKLEVYHGE